MPPRPRPAAETANAAPPPQTAALTDAPPPAETAPPETDAAATLLEAYRRRIAELREYGLEEEVEISPDSERDFWAFMPTLPGAPQAALALTDDGTLRAVWGDADDPESHLGMEFLGGGWTRYVIFRRRAGAAKISRVAGTDTFQGVLRQLSAFDLRHLVPA